MFFADLGQDVFDPAQMFLEVPLNRIGIAANSASVIDRCWSNAVCWPNDKDR